MLPNYLLKFNEVISNFQEKFPGNEWNLEFRDSLINDFSLLLPFQNFNVLFICIQ